MFIIITNIVFNDYIYLYIKNKKKIFIEIDNEFKENLYENDISFSNYQTKLKPIAFYYPEYLNISFSKYFKKYNNKTNKSSISKLIKRQIKLAKKHGIYGFAIYFNLSNLNYYFDITLIYY